MFKKKNLCTKILYLIFLLRKIILFRRKILNLAFFFIFFFYIYIKEEMIFIKRNSDLFLI